jgi:hypothetical protein
MPSIYVLPLTDWPTKFETGRNNLQSAKCSCCVSYDVACYNTNPSLAKGFAGNERRIHSPPDWTKEELQRSDAGWSAKPRRAERERWPHSLSLSLRRMSEACSLGGFCRRAIKTTALLKGMAAVEFPRTKAIFTEDRDLNNRYSSPRILGMVGTCSTHGEQVQRQETTLEINYKI